jgi:MFS family permease
VVTDAAADALLAPASVDGGVWAPHRRRLTVGLVLTITLVAFESLAVSTVMPVVSDDLGGLGLYGWVFSGFFLGNLFGVVTAGRMADRLGTARPFVLGLGLFAVGLVVGGLAPSMGVLVAARVGQGIGAGAIPAVAYTSVGRAYPAPLRPRVFAVFASAWVIPGLLGPAASSGLAHAFGWRSVFLALLPLVALAGWITVPALVHSVGVPPPRSDDAEPPAGNEGDARTGPALALIAGVAAVFVAAGGAPIGVAVVLVAVGVPVAVTAFVRLMPVGTLRLAPGIPTAVAVKGMLTFAFFGADAYVSLTLQDVRDQATWVAGAALTFTTISWTAAAWVQERVIHRVGPRRVVRIGFLILAAGIALLFGALGPLPVPVAVLVWGVGGFGIGLAYSPISIVVLGLAEPGREGAATSSIQLCDVLGIALGTGASGAFVALGDARSWDPATALRLAFSLTLAVALAGVVAARRLPTSVPD